MGTGPHQRAESAALSCARLNTEAVQTPGRKTDDPEARKRGVLPQYAVHPYAVAADHTCSTHKTKKKRKKGTGSICRVMCDVYLCKAEVKHMNMEMYGCIIVQ